ncbi:pyrophosphohydrolase domain-containing protein [Enterococcus sp. LJL98]
MKPYEMTEEFHRTFDTSGASSPTILSIEQASHRVGFKVEELVELLAATSAGEEEFEHAVAAMHQAVEAAKEKVRKKSEKRSDTLVEQVDALTDLLYFTYGTFSLMGINPEPMMAIVHQANMGKLFPDGRPHYDPVTNKVLKPPHWEKEYAPERKIRQALDQQIETKR